MYYHTTTRTVCLEMWSSERKARPECQTHDFHTTPPRHATRMRMRRKCSCVRHGLLHLNHWDCSLRSFCCDSSSAGQRKEVRKAYYTRCSLKASWTGYPPQDGSWPPRASPLNAFLSCSPRRIDQSLCYLKKTLPPCVAVRLPYRSIFSERPTELYLTGSEIGIVLECMVAM